jgi:cytochrome c biogenesis protein CcdA/thiol-disulfide isomerase/thioredoxin
MENTLVDIGLAFIEGLGLIASPCILPILPIFLSGSLSGSKKRPLGIILGFVLTFALFTYFSRLLVQYSGIDLNSIRHASYFILALLGIIMMSEYLSELFSRLTRKLGNVGASSTTLNNPQGGFGSGLLFGTLIALIWTPCAGAILAAVIVQVVTQKTSAASFLVLLSFGLGAGIPMLLIAVFGRYLMAKLTFFKVHSAMIRKILGAIILASVGWMVYQDGYATTSFTSNSSTPKVITHLQDGITPYPAPPIVGAVDWINSPPLDLSDLKGKVVLIDFWTYSCINCVRTLPFVTGWYKKYHNQGLEIIGVHTPEFEFEKDLNNVKAAVEKYHIEYPVVLDSNFGTWQSFKNRYWPAEYLIDKEGNVVYQHFGEGDDDIIENNIRFLLGLTSAVPPVPSAESLGGLFSGQTPETYLGTNRGEKYSSPEKFVNGGTGTYSFPQTLNADEWALQGKWIFGGEYITSAAENAALKIRFHAKKVYVVMGNSTDAPIDVKVTLDGEAIVNDKGSDVENSMVSVPGHGLYNVVSFSSAQSGVLTLTASKAGLEVYTFTFG